MFDSGGAAYVIFYAALPPYAIMIHSGLHSTPKITRSTYCVIIVGLTPSHFLLAFTRRGAAHRVIAPSSFTRVKAQTNWHGKNSPSWKSWACSMQEPSSCMDW